MQKNELPITFLLGKRRRNNRFLKDSKNDRTLLRGLDIYMCKHKGKKFTRKQKTKKKRIILNKQREKLCIETGKNPFR